MKKLTLAILFAALAATAQAQTLTTYHVATNGLDSRSCAQAQSAATPKRTFTSAILCLPAGGGGRIEGAAGTYAETLENSSIPSGSSWASPNVIDAAPNASVVIMPNAGAQSVVRLIGKSYIEFGAIIFDGTNVNSDVIGMTDPGNHHIRFRGTHIRNAGRARGGYGMALVGGFGSNGVTGDGADHEFLDCKIYNNGNTGYDHALYISADRTLIQGCEIYNNAGWGVHKYPDGNNFQILRNYIHDNGQSGFLGAPQGGGSGIGIYGGSGSIVRWNAIWNNHSDGIVANYGESNALIDNNTINRTAASAAIYIGDGISGMTVRNNLCINNAGNNCPLFETASHPGSVVSGNINTGSEASHFVNAAIGDLRLIAGSAALNGGGNIGLPCNGGCAAGVFDPMELIDVEVGSGGANKIRLTFDVDQSSPLKAANFAAGWSALKAGANDPVTAGALAGSAVIELTVQNDYSSTDTCSVTYVQASGSLTDSLNVGGVWSQPFLSRSNVICRNVVTGGGTIVLTMSAYRFRELYGTETGAGWKAAENTPYDWIIGGAGRLRLKANATGGDPPAFPVGFLKRITTPSGVVGPLTNLVDTCSAADPVCFFGATPNIIVTHNTPTTEQLTGSYANVPCAVLLTNSAPIIDFGPNTEAECEIAIKLDPSLPQKSKVEIFLTRSGGAQFEGNPVAIPTINVIDNQFIQDAKLEPKDVNLNVGNDWNFKVTRRTSDSSPTVTFSVPKSARVRVNGVMQ